MEHMADTIGGQKYFDQSYSFDSETWIDTDFNKQPCYFTEDFLVNSHGFDKAIFNDSRIVNVPKKHCKNQDKNYILVKDIDFNESLNAHDFEKIYICFEVREDLDLEKMIFEYSWKEHNKKIQEMRENRIKESVATAGIGAIYPEGYVEEKPVVNPIKKNLKRMRKLLAKRKK